VASPTWGIEPIHIPKPSFKAAVVDDGEDCSGHRVCLIPLDAAAWSKHQKGSMCHFGPIVWGHGDVEESHEDNVISALQFKTGCLPSVHHSQNDVHRQFRDWQEEGGRDIEPVQLSVQRELLRYRSKKSSSARSELCDKHAVVW
jgi:hypothetical protein